MRGRQTNSLDLDIIGGATFDRYKKQSIANTYNMIVSNVGPNRALVPFAGYKQSLLLLLNAVGRGLYKSSRFNHMISVVGDGVFIIDTNLTLTLVGRLDTSSGPVFIAENNNNQIGVVDGKSLFLLDFNDTENLTFNKILLGFNPLYITFIDGYFISPVRNSQEWRLSALNDGTSWPTGGANVGELETKPDHTLVTIAFNRQLFVMGNVTTEIWHDIGNTLFPFQRDNTISIDYGVVSADTVAARFGRLVWLAFNEQGTPVILISSGGPPAEISTDGIEFILGTITRPELASAFLFEQDGHIFYQITFPFDNLSLVYDFETQLFFTLTDPASNFHIARETVFFNNKNFFVSFNDGFLYEFGTKFTTYDGFSIPRSRITKNFRMKDGRRFPLLNANITLEQGASRELQAVDISMSKDGGASFGNIQRKKLNSLGNRRNRLRFWQLGSANDVVFRFDFWSGNSNSNIEDVLAVTSNGQTVFALSSFPVSNDGFTLKLNGQVRLRGTDYTQSGTILTWLDPGAETLVITDELIARYQGAATDQVPRNDQGVNATERFVILSGQLEVGV